MLLVLMNGWKINQHMQQFIMIIRLKKHTEALTVTNTSARIDRSSIYLFSRKVFAFDTFFPIADAFQEK